MTKIVVVGASGVVGRQLIPQLVAAGHEVVATTSTSGPPGRPSSVVWRRLDLLNETDVIRLVAQEQPAVIIHQATALKGLGNNLRRFDAAFARTNRLRTTGTRNLLMAAAMTGSPRLLVQSFCGWPWASVGGPVKDESDAWDPQPPKGFRRTFAALEALENMVQDYAGGVVLRYGGLYGPGTSLGVGGAQIEVIRKGLLPIVGSGAGVWSFLHVADAAAATVAALDRGAGVYNIVDDEPVSVAEWLPVLAQLTGGPVPRRVPTWVGRLIGGDGLVRLMTRVRGSSNTLARTELGWSPIYPSWRDGFAAELGSGPSRAESHLRRPFTS